MNAGPDDDDDDEDVEKVGRLPGLSSEVAKAKDRFEALDDEGDRMMPLPNDLTKEQAGEYLEEYGEEDDDDDDDIVGEGGWGVWRSTGCGAVDGHVGHGPAAAVSGAFGRAGGEERRDVCGVRRRGREVPEAY